MFHQKVTVPIPMGPVSTHDRAPLPILPLRMAAPSRETAVCESQGAAAPVRHRRFVLFKDCPLNATGGATVSRTWACVLQPRSFVRLNVIVVVPVWPDSGVTVISQDRFSR